MPFNLQLDLFGAIEKFVEFRKINEWVKLILSLTCSYWFSASFACGTALVSHASWPVAVGTGLLAGSTFATVVWRRSPLTKGMILVEPAEEAKKELETNTEVISK